MSITPEKPFLGLVCTPLGWCHPDYWDNGKGRPRCKLHLPVTEDAPFKLVQLVGTSLSPICQEKVTPTPTQGPCVPFPESHSHLLAGGEQAARRQLSINSESPLETFRQGNSDFLKSRFLK